MIGLNKISNDKNQWEWYDKSKTGSFNNWYKSSPKNVLKDCAVVEVSTKSGEPGLPPLFGYWSDVICDQRRNFICQNGRFCIDLLKNI